MRRRDLLTASLAGLSLGACAPTPRSPRPGPRWQTSAASTFEGRWISDGYGLLVELCHDEMRLYETTKVSCVLAVTLRRRGPAAAEQVFVAAEGALAVLDVDTGTFRLRRGPEPATARLHIDGAASDILLRRLVRRPAADEASSRGAPSARRNFDVFWQTFAEHYPFFASKGVDWASAGARGRARLRADAPPVELFGVLRELIEPLHDAHTSLVAEPLGLRFDGFRALPGGGDADDPTDFDARVERSLEVVRSRYLAGPTRSWLRGHLLHGSLEGGAVGYLRIDAFADYTPGGVFADELSALEAALDDAFTHAPSWRGLVIDVRVNGGGSDVLALAVAARLANEPYEAYAKVARNDPDDPTKFSAPQRSYVPRSPRPGFRGRAALLTSGHTISAGETFTQALLGRRPLVVRVGEPTQGVFSDVLLRRLPNRWHIGLPNEIFRSPDGRTFDGRGVPPDVVIPTLRVADLQAARDPALETALAWLRASGP